MSEPAPRLLLDRLEIHDLVLRYCRAVDRLHFDDIRAVYTDDAVDHHTGFTGTADEYVAWLREVLPRLQGTQHIVGNHLCEVAGDEAVAETYGTAVHWASAGDDPRRNFTTGLRYVDHLVRTPHGWRIRERFAVREWTHSDADIRIEPEADGPRGRRDGTDPIDLLRARVLHQDPAPGR